MPLMTRRQFAFTAASSAAAKERAWPVGVNTAISGVGLFESIETCRRLGFDTIEIHPMGRIEPVDGKFPGFEFDKLDASARKSLGAALKPFRGISTHLPYTGLDHMAEEPAVRAASRRTVEIAMEGSSEFGATMAVLHAQSKPDDELARRWNEYLDLYRRWADRAKQLGMRLTLETMFPRSVSGFVRMIREAGHPNLGCTIDVGHQSRYAELVARVRPEDRATPEGIRAYNDTTIAIVEQLGEKITHFHVHDIDPQTWVEHKPMVHGFVDYPRLFQVLKKIRYQGRLILEIGGPAQEMPGFLAEAKRKLEGWRNGVA
jgi:sugar phosphate isomerase/epimerase